MMESSLSRSFRRRLRGRWFFSGLTSFDLECETVGCETEMFETEICEEFELWEVENKCGGGSEFFISVSWLVLWSKTKNLNPVILGFCAHLYVFIRFSFAFNNNLIAILILVDGLQKFTKLVLPLHCGNTSNEDSSAKTGDPFLPLQFQRLQSQMHKWTAEDLETERLFL